MRKQRRQKHRVSASSRYGGWLFAPAILLAGVVFGFIGRTDREAAAAAGAAAKAEAPPARKSAKAKVAGAEKHAKAARAAKSAPKAEIAQAAVPEAEPEIAQEPAPEAEPDTAQLAAAERMQWMQRSNDVYSLHEGAAAGDVDVVRARLAEGDSPNAFNEQGNTPLHLAAIAGRAEAAELLLAGGADPLVKNKAGLIASAVAQDDAVRAVCEKGEAPRRREIAMAEDVVAGRVEAVKRGLAEGVNPNAFAADGTATLLLEAVRTGQLEIARMLVQAGADLHCTVQGGRGVLTLAASRGDVEMLRMLLDAGADPMHHTHHKGYPIHDAIWHNRTQAAVLLLPYYRHVNFNPHGAGNGYPICMAIHHGRVEVVRAFIKAGVRVNDPMFKDEPLLVVAVRSNRLEIVRMLLAAGADKNLRDASGKRAIDYADGEMKKLLR